MRERLINPSGFSTHVGITPAYAGKTNDRLEISNRFRDHPAYAGKTINIRL
ncbi:hypothetical protein TMU3MR103_2228 [Tetragenococcus muriaticus 3MR10-3]|uniref:Uncharacterized protein n=1 Tax=Tetragenococcus muriaticus 3MR10-3 TaxID=1302648 RepID=A0A091BWE5_9ENTE|nr:hypothetical protein TMU3MR103_2228 [Tetragenococcus muriaticus 3MR10-3]